MKIDVFRKQVIPYRSTLFLYVTDLLIPIIFVKILASYLTNVKLPTSSKLLNLHQNKMSLMVLITNYTKMAPKHAVITYCYLWLVDTEGSRKITLAVLF